MDTTTLVLLAATDVLIAVAVADDKTLWPVLVLLSLGLAAILWPSAPRPAWLTPHCALPYQREFPWP
ncbi:MULTISPECIES: hypothetical protein [unclassified Streptomyces]|uniref:hypothetical protein n=1 Tax=unclassified Streptomyces TaxID=2593676 RepID=UPI002034EFB1|nr:MULTISPECIES: hypothetical protein [unclassified Streptomyces]